MLYALAVPPTLSHHNHHHRHQIVHSTHRKVFPALLCSRPLPPKSEHPLSEILSSSKSQRRATARDSHMFLHRHDAKQPLPHLQLKQAHGALPHYYFQLMKRQITQRPSIKVDPVPAMHTIMPTIPYVPSH